MDFTDCVLAHYPQMDADRLGVTGGSYGGFMTNWIIGHTHRFACAASQRSISNFVSMEGTSDCGRTFVDGHLAAHTSAGRGQGVGPIAPECGRSAAPRPPCSSIPKRITAAGRSRVCRCSTPSVPTGWKLVCACFKGENHELSRGGKPKNRVKRLQEITRWMDHYLRP